MANIYSKTKLLFIAAAVGGWLIASFSSAAFPVHGPGNNLLVLGESPGSGHLKTESMATCGLSLVSDGSKKTATHEVKGLVTDSSGAPLPGVNIVVKDKISVGTTTDLNGRYILEVPDNAVLVFSMVGFEPQEISTAGTTEVNVRLLPTRSLLGETVVVAFGTQKRSDMVGAVTSVNVADLKTPSSNLTTALAGRIAGMIAFQRSGEPGKDNANFFIRGVASFGVGKVDPLMLIDGVESSVTELARLQPDDIASFSVLKDATATALYGSRAANGVILITTKEGKEGKVKISLRAENSWSMPTSNVKLADPVTYMKLYNEAALARDPFAASVYSHAKIDGTISGQNPLAFPATDWRKMLFKDYALNQRYNLNVSGGGKVARYYVAGSYSKDNGVLRVDHRNNFNNNIDLKSYTLRANVNISLTKTTELEVRLNGNFDDYQGPLSGGAAMYNEVVNTSPVDFPAYYPADSAHSYLNHIMFGGLRNKNFSNPYADMVKGYQNSSRTLMLAQLEIKQDLSFITSGLTLHAMMNTNRISSFEVARQYAPFYYDLTSYDPVTKQYSILNFNEEAATEYLDYNLPARSQSNAFYLQSTLNYDRTVHDKNHFSGMLVYYMQSTINANPASLQLSLASRNIGLSGRGTYSFDNRYYTEFNFGYNGSERFYKSRRFGFFPSFGLAWSVSNEKFWKPLSRVVSNFRLRGTYGLVGNDQIGAADDRFFYLSEVNMNDPAHDGHFGMDNAYSANGITVTRYSNPEITWEVAHKTNIGVELGLFNKLNIKADFYSQVRKNILMTRASIPTTMGLSASVRANVGESSGKGLELSADYEEFFSHEIWLKVLGNFTYSTDKYKVYEEPDYKSEPWLSHKGLALSQPIGFIAERLFVDSVDVSSSPPQAFGSSVIAGDIKYKDINKDGQITDLDQVPIGFPTTPEIVYGFGFSFGYKNFDVSTFFQGVARESFWINPASVQPFVNGGRQILKVFADNHYTTDNQDVYALWPRLSTVNNGNDNQLSTWWLRNGAFLRFKQAEIGWTFPQGWLKKTHMQSTRIYVNATNLLEISSFKLWDVEMGGFGLGYPIQRVINMGININF
ncbi:MAG TPA: TonB-dependent receptor [Chitinophagaceae bacterium]|nr:TonB-dependent receptor [Chitinophagaceae bacterium]